MKNKFITIFLSICLVCFNTIVFAVEQNDFNDIKGHWAEETITRYSEANMINGYPDGAFRPDNDVTRAELITLVNTFYGLKETSEENYDDVNSEDWFAQQASKAKYFEYVNELNLRPNDKASRKEIVDIVDLLMDLQEEPIKEESQDFKDLEEDKDFQEKVKKFSGLGYLHGYSDETFRPDGKVTRAEILTIFQNSLGYIVRTQEDMENIPQDITKITIINPNIVIEDKNIQADIYLTQGVNGKVQIKNTKIAGNIIVSASQEKGAVVFDHAEVKNLVVTKAKNTAHILITGESNVKRIKTKSTSDIEIAQKSTIESINTKANTDLNFKDKSKAKNVITEAKTEITTEKSTEIEKMETKEKTIVSGEGTIKKAFIKAEGVIIEKAPAYVEVEDEIKKSDIGGSNITKDTDDKIEPSGGGGSSSDDDSSKSSNNNLKSLVISDGSLSPNFNSNTTSYMVVADSETDSIRVIPTVSHSRAKVKVNGVQVVSGQSSQEITLDVGKNTINVDVIAQNGRLKTYTITVTKASKPTVSFTTDTQQVTENVGTVDINLILSEALENDVVVSYHIGENSTATKDLDFTTSSDKVTIPAGQTTGTISISVTDDALVEGEESIVIHIDSPTNVVTGAFGTHTIIINDNDGAATVNYVSSTNENGNYKAGDTIIITVHFNKEVLVTGTPQIILNTGEIGKKVDYVNGSGSDSLEFTYTVQSEDNTNDLDYIDSNSLILNGGTMKDKDTNDVILTLPTPGTDNSLSGTKDIVIDNREPSGYGINIDQSVIHNENQTDVSFTFDVAEVGATYYYSIDDTNSKTKAITGSGKIVTATDQISGINVSSLDDDTLTITVYLMDAAGNEGYEVEDTVIKDTSQPRGYSVSIDQSAINNENKTELSFTFAGAEVGATYSYSINDDNATTDAIAGSGTIETATDQITGIDVSNLEDGTLTLTAYLTDTVGNKGESVTDTVEKNAEPPSGYGVSIDQAEINNENKTALSFTFAGAEVGATYSYSIDDNNATTGAIAGSGTIETETDQITDIDVSSLEDGTLTLTVYLTDVGGNQGCNTTDTIHKDTASPQGYTVDIVQPDINSTNKTNLSFKFVGAEIGATYYYSIDDENSETDAVTGNAEVASSTEEVSGIDVSSLEDGTLTLTVYLTDTVGNQGIDVTDTVEKNAEPPSGYGVSIDQARINNQTKTGLSFTFAGAEAGATYSYSIDDNNATTNAITGSGTIETATDQITGIDVSSLEDGTLTLTVYLTDVGGNQGGDIIDSVIKDTVKPTGYSVDIIQESINSENETDFSFIFSGGEVGATYQYSIDDNNGGTTAITGNGMLGMATDQITGIDVSTLDDDTLTLTVYLTDEAGNQGIDVTDTVVKNAEPPTGYNVKIDQSAIDCDNETTLSFTFSEAEVGATYEFSIDDAESSTIPVTGNGTIETKTDQITGIDVSGLEDGTLTLTVSLTDDSENQGIDVTDTIDKDTNKPQVLEVTPESNTSDVSVDSDIKLQFNESMDSNQTSGWSVNLQTGEVNLSSSNADISFITTSEENDTVVINPDSDLSNDTQYGDITVTGFTDVVGNEQEGFTDNGYTFTTEAGSSVPDKLIVHDKFWYDIDGDTFIYNEDINGKPSYLESDTLNSNNYMNGKIIWSGTKWEVYYKNKGDLNFTLEARNNEDTPLPPTNGWLYDEEDIQFLYTFSIEYPN